MTDNTELARQTPSPVEVSRLADFRRIAEAYGSAMYSAGMDANSDFQDRQRDSDDKRYEALADLIEELSALASMASTPVGEVPAGTSEVCKHGIRHPHECRECADAAWIEHKANTPTGYPENTEEDFLADVYDNCCRIIKPAVDRGILPGSVTESLEMLVAEKLAASPAPAASKVPTMEDALAAGDGTLHGAIDYWQNRALAAEAARDVDETNKVFADNYIELTAASKGAEAVARVRRYKTPEGYEHWEFVGERYPFFDLPHGEHVLVLASPSPAASMEVQGLDANAIRLATLEEAARACEKLAEDRFNDHGTREPDTGACYCGGRIEEEYQTRDEEDDECAKAIRALAAKNGWRLGEGRG